MSKIKLLPHGLEHSSGRNLRTDHLRPVLEYLLTQGNRPAQWWQEDGWRSDPGGELHYIVTDPLNAAELREHFVFPDSIQVQEDGSIRDSLNRVDICHERPTRPLSFELAPKHAPVAVDTLLITDPPAVDDGEADEKLRQIIAARQK